MLFAGYGLSTAPDLSRSEDTARRSADGSIEIDLTPDGETPVRVYYWVGYIDHQPGRVWQPEIEIEMYDSETGDAREFDSDDEEERVVRLCIEDWREPGYGFELEPDEF